MALAELIARLGSRPAQAAIVLSNRFVRYALVPWNERLTTEQEEAAYARHSLAGVYGDAAETWDVRLSPAAPGEARVASAVDGDLVRTLKDVMEASPLKLESLQPHLMTAFNRWRRSLDKRAGLFLVAEKRVYTCMALARGVCRAVRSGPVNGRLEDDLPQIVDREHLWSGLEDTPSVALYAPEDPQVELRVRDGWAGRTLRLQPFPNFTPESDADYAMAAGLV
jgi:hypothetical protein